ncbi:hypothetical protein O181_083515 [Austropuccinia psidii MF-1]|uniref:Origin recognition complex subunit 6 n=1 Tax=Austropuccinia psidii MF-1 TaxID=1389203 RepID=A0A9Q3FTW0_9BASI|nr:hypothetical protein [Austropuccinia psidii MF-1]
MASRGSVRDVMTWGSILGLESDDVARRARNTFQRAKQKLSVESGHGIVGINGNDRALACLSLCLVKISAIGSSERKALETSLQRASGVSPRIFSNAIKTLSSLLGTASGSNSPVKSSPARANKSASIEKSLINDTPTKRKRTINSLEVSPVKHSALKPSPLKRLAHTASDSEDEILLSPTGKKRIRTSGPQEWLAMTEDHNSHTPRAAKLSQSNQNSARTIKKTPLNLPIQRPPKPMCIFQSQPISRSRSHYPVNFSDWNWKLNLFKKEWSSHDIHEWEKWRQKSIESSLS